MMVEEETEQEVDAAISVYGADCTVICRFPPHLLVRLQPRTANDVSQQFVEAVLMIQANSKYPEEPPMLELKDTKGLEDAKATRILSDLRDLASDLASNPMLVAICEVVVLHTPTTTREVMENKFTIMKLISCFHCFHSECFIRWWRWMLQGRGLDVSDLFLALQLEEDKDSVASCEKLLEQTEVNCPVCRKAIHPHDLASVWGALFVDNGQEDEIVPDAEVIFSKSERERKAKFDTLFKVQQDRGGIVEPKKLEVIVPGMFVSVPSTRATESGSGLATASFELPESSSLSASAVECESSQQDNILLSQGRQHVLGAETISDNGRIPKSGGRGLNQPRVRYGRQVNRGGTRRGNWVRRDRGTGLNE
ncbi:hypothetical protein KP509_05G003800 [Ceratopteris richardii]|uniref:RWD domain-containing protein n=1 Tax=Ceratopteris richardii TaxID=49495 RepID=A0A8T2UQH0_CERRI|nr:hypothetical protein KP509_05G003800 [Ceratopteris richardii]